MKFLSRLFPADMWAGRLALLVIAAFFKLLIFDVIWCSGTTFRAMSDIGLYVNAIFVALIIVLPYVLTRRLWVESVIFFLVDILLICNLMYCRTYFTAIPLDSYLLAGNLSDFKASVVDSMRWYDILLPLSTLAAIIVCLPAIKKFPKGYLWKYLLTTLAAGLLAFLTALSKGGFMAHYSKLQESCYYTTCTTPIYTVGGSMIYDAVSTSKKLSDEERRMVSDWIEQKNAVRPYIPLPDSIPGRKNLVIVLCESLESWVIDREIDGKQITPVMNSLLNDSSTLYAPHVLTQVSSGRSIDCQLLLNAGMLPMLSSVYSMKYPGNRYYTINQALAEKNGARSYILTCDKPIVWNQEPIARAFGVDTLLDRSSWRNDELVGNPAKLSDGSFLRQSVEKMKSGEIWPEGEAGFVQFVTYSGHNPFRLPEKLKGIEFDEKYPQRMRDYMTMANYTDRSIGELLDYLRSRSDYDSTLIVITGDHEGLASDRAKILESAAAKGIVPEGQYTPFIVLNSPVGGRYDKVMGQIDMYPTLLNLMHLDDYEWKGMGQSIFTPGKPAFAISSMTNRIEGDTAGVDEAVFRNIKDARTVSDKIITFDLLRAQP